MENKKKVLLVMLSEPPVLKTPAPKPPVALLPEKVLFVMVNVPLLL